MFRYITYYLLIGTFSLMIMDYMVNKVAKILGKEPFTNGERIIILILWPIYTFVFWYNFLKAFFGSRKE